MSENELIEAMKLFYPLEQSEKLLYSLKLFSTNDDHNNDKNNRLLLDFPQIAFFKKRCFLSFEEKDSLITDMMFSKKISIKDSNNKNCPMNYEQDLTIHHISANDISTHFNVNLNHDDQIYLGTSYLKSLVATGHGEKKMITSDNQYEVQINEKYQGEAKTQFASSFQFQSHIYLNYQFMSNELKFFYFNQLWNLGEVEIQINSEILSKTEKYFIQGAEVSVARWNELRGKAGVVPFTF